MAKGKKEVPPEKFALFVALIDTHPEIKTKGKTSPYTSVNGHMFNIIGQFGLYPHRGSNTGL